MLRMIVGIQTVEADLRVNDISLVLQDPAEGVRRLCLFVWRALEGHMLQISILAQYQLDFLPKRLHQ